MLCKLYTYLFIIRSRPRSLLSPQPGSTLLSPSSTSVAPAPATTSPWFSLASLSPSVCPSLAGVCPTRTRGSGARTAVSSSTTTTTSRRLHTTPSCLPSKRVVSSFCWSFLLWGPYSFVHCCITSQTLLYVHQRKVSQNSPSTRESYTCSNYLFVILIPVNILKGSLPFVI
jgi:hypothetical protein